MFPNIKISEFVCLIFYVIYIQLISGKKLYPVKDKNMAIKEKANFILGIINKKQEYLEFCESINLNVSVLINEENYSVTVAFVASQLEYKDCFEYYNITLENENEIKNYSLVRNKNDDRGGASHAFTNVNCGIYKITIYPCYNSKECDVSNIGHPELINMTSFECIGLSVKNKLIAEHQIDKKIIFIIAVICVFLVLTFTGLMICYYKSENSKEKAVSHKEDQFTDFKTEDSPTSRIEVYVIHYYGKNIENKWKIKAFKEFCLLSGYFDAVKTIEDELSLILFDVDDHLNKMMEKRGDDGTLRKIILFASDNDEEDETHGLENIIFSKIIHKIKDNIEECLYGYDHIFVVKLGSSVNCPTMLKGIVKRNRFTFSYDLMDEHLVNLCLNMCSGSNLNMLDVEINLKKLLPALHPFKYFESTV